MLLTRMVLAGAFVGVLSGATLAQDIILAPEEEIIVREYVVKQPREEVIVPDDFELEVGAELPDTVVVSRVEAPGVERVYEYAVIDGRTALVDPETREIVKILD